MIFRNKTKKDRKEICSICHQKPPTATIVGPLGSKKVCKECKKHVKIWEKIRVAEAAKKQWKLFLYSFWNEKQKKRA